MSWCSCLKTMRKKRKNNWYTCLLCVCKFLFRANKDCTDINTVTRLFGVISFTLPVKSEKWTDEKNKLTIKSGYILLRIGQRTHNKSNTNFEDFTFADIRTTNKLTQNFIIRNRSSYQIKMPQTIVLKIL